MAEAFVKTFKRDYVYLNKLERAEVVMSQLDAWFHDYNEVHPHLDLRAFANIAGVQHPLTLNPVDVIGPA
jgi:transposase InsO family protein